MEQQRPNVRCLIAAGGTAGHVAPSLAVAEALQRRGVHVTFAGSPDRIEARLVPEAGYELDTFRVSGLPRRPSPALLRGLLLAGLAPRACGRILAARRPDVVLGGGGYAAGPAVLHLCGTRDYDVLRPRLTRPDYRLYAFTEEFGAALGACDLALARAGGSVWELAAAGKPAVLIPGLFATGDHQAKNARYFEQAGAAVVVPEQEAGRAPDVVRSLLDDPRRLGDMSRAMLRVARPHAADEIAEELIALTA